MAPELPSADPVCFVDTETTGLDPERHQIWEVALITPDGKERVWQFYVADELVCDPFALDIGQWWQRKWGHDVDVSYVNAVYDADDLAKSRRQHFPSQGLALSGPTAIHAWCKEFRRLTTGLHLAGAVVSFDEERLRKLLRANGALPRWHYHLVDVEALAAGYLAGADERRYAKEARPPWSSETLSLAVGVNPADFDRHTALGDARWAKAIYEAVLR